MRDLWLYRARRRAIRLVSRNQGVGHESPRVPGTGNQGMGRGTDPVVQADTDVVVRVDTTTICGSDLHILKGDTPEVTAGRILGHEAVGTVEAVGSGVKTVAVGDRVLVSCISACGTAGTAATESLRTVSRRWRLDPRPHHRWDPGGIRPGTVCRHIHLRRTRRGRRRSDSHAGRHPPHRVRGRCPQRHGAAG